MEETNQSAGGQNQIPSGDENNKEDHVRYSTYQKTLDQEKAAKKRASEIASENENLKRRLEEIELLDQEKKGNTQDVINGLRDRIKELEGTNDKTKTTFIDTRKHDAIKLAAKDRNCVNPNALVKLLDSNDLSMVEVGENYEVNMDDVKNILDDSEKKYEFLFKASNVRVSDKTPSKPDTTKKPTNVRSLTREQLNKAMSSMSKEEFDRYILNLDKVY